MGVEDWRINEVVASVGGDPNVRFVELYVPSTPSADNCFYASTVLEILDADGPLVGSVPAVPSGIECFPGNTFFMFATTEAVDTFGQSRDRPLTVQIPQSDGGQVCLKSSATRYDCVRWGAITNPANDLFGPDDDSVAPTPADGMALARTANTHVVAADWDLQAPTMRQPNDGTTWIPPDAGPPPDADTRPDAGIYDAWILADAPPVERADARIGQPDYFAADPGGGAHLSCAATPGSVSPAAWLLPTFFLFLVCKRRL